MHEAAALFEGARCCVKGYTGVRPGEEVLLWTDRSARVHPEVVDALAAGVIDAGARVTILNEDAPFFRFGEPLSRIAGRALESADVILHVFDLENAASVDSIDIRRVLFEYDTRITSVIAVRSDDLASDWARYPVELFRSLWWKSILQVKDAGFHVTDANGTDLRGRLRAIPLAPAETFYRQSGVWRFFPGGQIALHPVEAEGVVVAEVLEGARGLLREPVRFAVQDHWVTAVDGGEEARWLRDLMGRFEGSGYFCEIAWGVHPRASVQRGLEEKAVDTILLRRSGTFHFGLGMVPGAGVFTRFHWDGGSLRPTLTIGEERIVEDGRLLLLDDPEIRSVAERLGDPKVLLAEAL